MKIVKLEQRLALEGRGKEGTQLKESSGNPGLRSHEGVSIKESVLARKAMT